MTKKLFSVLVATVMLLSFSGCVTSTTITNTVTKNDTKTVTNNQTQTVTVTQDPTTVTVPAPEEPYQIEYKYCTVNADGSRTFTDFNGVEITVPETVDCMLTVAWPGNSPILQLLNLDEIIPAYNSIVKGAEYYWLQKMNPNVLTKPTLGSTAEEIMTYDPDIVFVKTKEQQDAFLAAGIPTAVMIGESIDDTLKAIRMYAEISGREDAVQRADAYINFYEKTEKLITDPLRGIDVAIWPTVYMVNGQHGTTPLLTNGLGGYWIDRGKLCCYKYNPNNNKASTAKVEVTAETLMDADPDWMFVYGNNSAEAYKNTINDPALAELSAIKTIGLLSHRGEFSLLLEVVVNALFTKFGLHRRFILISLQMSLSKA